MQPGEAAGDLNAGCGDRIAWFGPFALNVETGELLRNGIRVRLQNKPFQLLKVLIEQRGRVVSREQLRACLWPADTFVDFESGLNTAANRLRVALCDSAGNPRYVETLPRVGYRFIGTVRLSGSHEPASEATGQQFLPEAAQPSAPIADTLPAAAPLRAESGATRWIALVIAAFALAAFGLLYRSAPGATPTFKQLTFRPGVVENARFTSSGAIVYDARWDSQPRRIYFLDPAHPDERQIDLGSALLAAVSRKSELAVLRSGKTPSELNEELVVAGLGGESPRTVDNHIGFADWSPDGRVLCVVREGPQGVTLEYPAGKVIYRTAGWLASPRVSPDGDRVAFVEHPLLDDDAGSLVVVDRKGDSRQLGGRWASMGTLAWHPGGSSIWFSAARSGLNRAVYSVSLGGRLRRIVSIPAVLDLFDIASSGRALIGRSVLQRTMYVGDLRSLSVRDKSWLDWSHPVAVSADGTRVLFDESGEGGGPLYTVFIYDRQRNATRRIGPGRALDISPDGRWILTGSTSDNYELTLTCPEDCRPRKLRSTQGMYQSARFLPHSQDLVVRVSDGKKAEWSLQNIDTGRMRMIAGSEGIDQLVPSPDGRFLAGSLSHTELVLFDVLHDQKSTVRLSEAGVPVAWTSSNELVLQGTKDDAILRRRFNLIDHRSIVAQQIPQNLVRGADASCSLIVSANLATFAFSKLETSTGLFAVDGWS